MANSQNIQWQQGSEATGEKNSMLGKVLKISGLLVAGIGLAYFGGDLLMNIADQIGGDTVTRLAEGGGVTVEIGGAAHTIPAFIGSLGAGLFAGATGITAFLGTVISTPFEWVAGLFTSGTEQIAEQAQGMSDITKASIAAGVGAVGGALAHKAVSKCEEPQDCRGRSDRKVYGEHTRRLIAAEQAALNSQRQV